MLLVDHIPIRFIITGTGRCGSNLVYFALKKHIYCNIGEEIFNKWVFRGIEKIDGATRANKWFIQKENAAIWKAIGFKIFYHHVSEQNKSVWSYLIKQKIRVIHLTRHNLFETILSKSIAHKTRIWNTPINNPSFVVKTPNIQIDRPPKWWADQFESTNLMERKLRNIFQHNPYLRLYYEDDITQYWDRTINIIQTFIGLSQISIGKLIKKQSIVPVHTQVTNYEILRKYFKGTQWEHFFPEF